MSTESSQHSAAATKRLVASPWHTLMVIAFGALNAYRGILGAAAARAGTGQGRTQMYLRTIAIEILFLGIVVVGIRLWGTPFEVLFGQRWKSMGQMARDLGLGLLLLVSATVLVSVLGGHPHGSSPNQAITYLLPQTPIELVLWLVLSVVAGICEEAVYRGYLQVQFTALTRSVPAGILISAAAFGAAHSYQGLGRALVIAVSALLYGAFAHWRGTLRPGMFAHSLQDALAPFLLKLVRR